MDDFLTVNEYIEQNDIKNIEILFLDEEELDDFLNDPSVSKLALTRNEKTGKVDDFFVQKSYRYILIRVKE
ncbi:hypothetical protein [Mycoplasma yeatsii]|uniref:hypothetical protein n=1 Tax=Mycoplasma yeatsii TaxID=51365 RepID=UPI0005B24A14|nr:hypothetical protein [Mycoplasma yeatsii]AJM71553.1 hypothetical protein MYE_00280 [Mycoplasma yeatsii GM274B]